MDLTIELIIIGLYLIFLVAIGMVFARFNNDVSDYFRNGCRGTWWLVGASLFMSGISAVTFTGNAGVVFEAGWSILVVYGVNVFAGVIAAIWLAPWFRQLRAITAPEIFRQRFGPKTQQFYAYTSLLLTVPGAGITLWALAIFASSVFGMDIRLVIIALGAVVAFYSVTGGSWAVMATDFIQGLVMVAMTLLVTILCLKEVGGIGRFFALISERGLSDDFQIINAPGAFTDNKYALSWALGIGIIQLTHQIGLNAAPRYFAAKDGREARRAAILSTVLMTLGTAFWFIPPITARLLYEEQTLAMALNQPAEAAYAVASMNLLPRGLAGMMVVAMFAATMSSMDTALNRTAAVFVRDIFPPLCRKAGGVMPKEHALVTLSRVLTLALGVLVVCVALYFAAVGGKGMFTIMFTISGLIGLPLVIPMVLGLFIQRAPGWSCLCSVAFSCVPASISVLGPKLFGMAPWNVQQNALYILPAGCLGFLVGRVCWRFTPDAERERIEAFFKQMHRPIDFAAEVGEGNDADQLRLVGGFSMAVGGFVACLMVAPEDWTGRLCVAGVSAFMLAVGSALFYAGRRGKQRT